MTHGCLSMCVCSVCSRCSKCSILPGLKSLRADWMIKFDCTNQNRIKSTRSVVMDISLVFTWFKQEDHWKEVTRAHFPFPAVFSSFVSDLEELLFIFRGFLVDHKHGLQAIYLWRSCFNDCRVRYVAKCVYCWFQSGSRSWRGKLSLEYMLSAIMMYRIHDEKNSLLNLRSLE